MIFSSNSEFVSHNSVFLELQIYISQLQVNITVQTFFQNFET